MTIAGPSRATELEAEENRGDRVARLLEEWAGLWLPAIVLGILYLWPALSGSLDAPAGFDTPKYVWRTELVQASGLDALTTLPGGVEASPGRPAYPLVVGLLASALPGGPYELAFVVPAVFGALIGLAGGAMAMVALNEPRWAFPVYALSVGASVNVALTAVGHADNLLASLLLLGCAAVALRAGGGRAPLAAGALLLVAALVTHWVFAGLFLLVLALLAGGSMIARWWRSAVPAPARSGLLRLVLLSAIAGAALLVVLVPGGAETPSLSRESFLDKLEIYGPYYVLPAVVPLATLGAVLLWRGADPRGSEGHGSEGRGVERRGGVLLCILWSSIAAVAGLGLALGAAVPLHRMVAFALSIPMLAIAPAIWLARRIVDRGVGSAAGASGAGEAGDADGRRRSAAAAILTVAVTSFVALGANAWGDKATSIITPLAYREASTADAYRQQLASGRPAIFLLSRDQLRPGSTAAAADHVLRLAAAPERVRSLAVYVGDAENLLAGRPTIRPGDEAFGRDSLRYWSGVRQLLDDDPVILALSSMVDALPPAPGRASATLAAKGVAVLRGPAPAGTFALAPGPAKPSGLALVGLTAGAGLLLIGVGLGWSILLPFARRERIALAPALGLAALILVGLVGDPLGVRTAAAGGIAILLLAALLGWLPKLILAVADRRVKRPASRP